MGAYSCQADLGSSWASCLARLIGGLYGRLVGRGMVDVFGIFLPPSAGGTEATRLWAWMDPGAFALIGKSMTNSLADNNASDFLQILNKHAGNDATNISTKLKPVTHRHHMVCGSPALLL